MSVQFCEHDYSAELKEIADVLDIEPCVGDAICIRDTLRAVLQKLKKNQPANITPENVLGNSEEEDALFARMRRAQANVVVAVGARDISDGSKV